MAESLFRQKSLDRISSPEELNSYMRVANPSVWIIVIAVVLLLVGGIIWGIAGYVDSTVPAAVVSRNGETRVYFSEEYFGRVEAGMTLRVQGEEYVLDSIEPAPVEAKDNLPDYTLRVGGFSEGEYVYEASVSGAVSEGTRAAEIVTERIHALSLLWN